MVLDDLYCGNIYPAEQVVPHEKEYRKLHRHTGELLTELEEKLSKEQMELVNQFHTQPGGELLGPLAIVQFGGLVTATILNLLIIPATAKLFSRWIASRRKELKATS